MSSNLATKIVEDNAKTIEEIIKLAEDEKVKVLMEQPYQFFKNLKYLDDKIANEVHKVNLLIFNV